MKRISVVFLIVVFLICTQISFAQLTFKKVYAGAAGTQIAYLSELNNHNFFTGIAGGIGSGISILDSLGNFLYQHTYNIDTFLALRRIEKISDTKYYFSANYYRDSCQNFVNMYPVIGKMDSSGNILSAKYYHLNPDCMNPGGDLEITSDGGLILGGEGYYVLRVDSNLNLLWSKYFGGYYIGIQFVKTTPNNNILIGMNTESAGAAVVKLDSAGNIVWCKSYFRPRGQVHDCIIDYDGSYLITGFTDTIAPPWGFPPYPAWFTPKYFMMKLDTSGEVLWCKGYDSNNHWLMKQDSRIINTLDGNHLIYATVLTSSSFVPLLIKTDINGDTLWTRIHEAPQHWYDHNASLIATSDGGYLFDGIIHGPIYGGLFLYKTDSLGRTTCHERYETIYVYNLFPNDSDFTMSFSTGGYSLPATINNISGSFPPISSECPTNIAASGASKRNFTLFPNPTSGKVHIHREDPYISNCYYSVYNSQGRLLIQQKFIDGKEDTPVDLSKYSKGVYLIKITDGVEVITKKVVLE